MSTWNPMRQAFDAEPVTLADFLRARIAEDERRARSVRRMNNGLDGGPTMPEIIWDGRGATIVPHGDWSELGRRLTEDEYTAMVERCSTQAEPDPRVLAECESKRRIVALHSGDRWECPACAAEETFSDDSDGHREWSRSAEPAPCPTLRALAMPYAGHPDYREEWRP